MKKFLFVSLCMFCIFGCSNNGPDPSSPPNNNTPVTDSLGTGWSMDSVSADDVKDIAFANNQLGYLADEHTIRKSTDGGHHWGSIANGIGIYNIAVTPDGKFFGSNGYSKIFFSSNGMGIDSVSLGLNLHLKDIYFVDNDNGFVVTDHELFKTLNGGITWDEVSLDPGSSHDFAGLAQTLFFLDSNTGWINSWASCVHSQNGITNWQLALTTFPNAGSFTSVYATDANNVYTANNDGKIYKSADGGLNFSLIASFPDPDSFNAVVSFVDNNIGYFAYGTHIYKTTNAGNSWTPVVSLASKRFIDMFFLDANHGWACGEDGLVLLFQQ